MKIRDKIGLGITSFLLPYMQNHSEIRGVNMPRKELEYNNYALQEKYLWFLGNEDLLVDFYNTRTQSYTTIDTKKSYYYSNVNEKIRIVHSGLPSLISYSKANLLLSGGVNEVVNYKEEEDEEKTELLKKILKDNEKTKLLTSAITTESWGGSFAFKISFDKEVSQYPIVEKYTPLNSKVIKKRGRVHEIVFIEHYEGYELEEVYGWGYVNYKLFRTKGGKKVEVPLNSIPETAELEEMKFDNDIMLAMCKETQKSDYNGLIAEFDAIDEIWSQLMDEVRTGRAETYVPEILMDNKQFNDFRKKYVVTGTDLKENGKNEITHNQPDIRTASYTQALLAVRDNILACVGLSPITIGVNEGVGSNSSGEALTKREIVSLRTRNQMISTWEEFLSEFYLLLLKSYYWYEKKTYTDLEVKVTFEDYITPEKNEVVERVIKLRDAEVIDAERSLKELYGDELSEEEKVRILQNTGNISFMSDDDVRSA